MYISKEDIDSLDRFKRSNIINSISGIKSANLIGTMSNVGVSNLAVFSSIFHLGSSPALLGFVMRPVDGFRRDTYENIKQNGCFTINHIHEKFVKKAHFTSAKFKQDESEFTKCKLTEEFLKDFTAPFVKESKLKIGLKIVETVELKSNKCLILIGSVEHLFIQDENICNSGNINLQLLNTVGVNGLGDYYQLKKIVGLPYVKDILPL